MVRIRYYWVHGDDTKSWCRFVMYVTIQMIWWSKSSFWDITVACIVHCCIFYIHGQLQSQQWNSGQVYIWNVWSLSKESWNVSSSNSSFIMPVTACNNMLTLSLIQLLHAISMSWQQLTSICHTIGAVIHQYYINPTLAIYNCNSLTCTYSCSAICKSL